MKLTRAFNLLFHTKVLTNAEKIEWITANNRKLPPPFLLLNAVLISNTKADLPKAGAWFVFANLRMAIDAEKCISLSAKEGLQTMALLLLPLFNLHQGINNDITNMAWVKALHKLTVNCIDQGIQLHRDNPTSVSEPYWLSNHGLELIKEALGIGTGTADDVVFDHDDHAGNYHLDDSHEPQPANPKLPFVLK